MKDHRAYPFDTRRIRLIPGLRVNFRKSGVSLSIGHRGAWYSAGGR